MQSSGCKIEEFTKANGSLRDKKSVLDSWIGDYRKTAAGGARGGHKYPFKKGDDYIAIIDRQYDWIRGTRGDASFKCSCKIKR